MNEQPASKQDLQDLRQELKLDMQDLELRQKQNMQELELKLKQNMQELELGLKQNMQDLELRIVERLTEFTRDIETKLLTSFHGYGKGQSARMHSLESIQGDVGIRIAALEERVLNLETGHGPGQH